jgi:DNA-binding response OmpR family regulator
MIKRTVLVVDNDSDFLDTWADALSQDNYSVYKAVSLHEAERLLEQTWIDLAIVDLRMQDDDDDKDVSGLVWAKKEEYRLIPKIILTRFASYQLVREALAPLLEGLPPAVDFIAKQDGLKHRLQAVSEVYDKFVRLNWDLVVHFSSITSFSQMIQLINNKLDESVSAAWADELEHLFRRLFHQSKQITVGRMLSAVDGQISLEVFAFGDERLTEQFVVSCGRRLLIKEEGYRYESFVLPNALAQNTQMAEIAETVHLGAIAYKVTGLNLEETVAFRNYYQGGTGEDISRLIDILYGQTLAPFFNLDRAYQADHSLRSLYRDHLHRFRRMDIPSDFSEKVDLLCRAASDTGLIHATSTLHELTFRFLDGSSVTYPNPVTQVLDSRLTVHFPAAFGVIYGLLNADGWLVTEQGQIQLVGFRSTGFGSLCDDFAALETAVRCDLFRSGNMEAVHETEERILAISRLGEQTDSTGFDAETKKMIEATNRIRDWASAIVGPEPEFYFLRLLFFNLQQLTGYNPRMIYTPYQISPFVRSLMSAAMLTARVMPAPKLPSELTLQAENSIWIDEANKEVWVEGRLVELSPLEYAALLYLYRNANQLCQRASLVENVYNEFYDAGISASDKGRIEEDRLNSLMSRLRQKIERNPKHPKFVKSKRGSGYKLELAEHFESDRKSPLP